MDCATYMCEEIVVQILARLPTKSLVRFMAVCRLWKSIITRPQFLLSNRNTKLLMHTDRECYSLLEDDHEENRPIIETDFPLKHPYCGRPTVIGSDNGLICIGITNPRNRGHNNFYRVIIWNPFIRKHVVIPDHHMDDVFTINNEYASGFGGTTSGGGDYKYVSLVLFRDGGGLKKAVDIYSLKSGTWRRKYLDRDFELGGRNNNTCALLRARLHWIGGGRTNEIFSFDLEDEVFENKFMVPESIQSPLIYVNVTVIRESLAVITNEIERGCSSVWVMEEYGDVNSWIKLFDIAREIFCRVQRNMVHFMKDGELLLGLRGATNPNKLNLVTYNPKTMKTRLIGDGSLSEVKVRGFTNYYKESLVLLGDHRAVGNQPTQQGHSKYGYYPARTGRIHWIISSFGT